MYDAICTRSLEKLEIVSSNLHRPTDSSLCCLCLSLSFSLSRLCAAALLLLCSGTLGKERERGRTRREAAHTQRATGEPIVILYHHIFIHDTYFYHTHDKYVHGTHIYIFYIFYKYYSTSYTYRYI